MGLINKLLNRALLITTKNMFNFIFCCSGTDPKTEHHEKNFADKQPEHFFRKTSSRKHGGRSQTEDAYGRI